MSTRCLTKIYEDGAPVACIYRHGDGYPEAMGVDLGNLLRGKIWTNGISNPDTDLNGPEKVAAHIVGTLYNQPYVNVYVYHPDTTDVGEEYVYEIRAKAAPELLRGADIEMTIREMYGDGEVIWQGVAGDFTKELCEKIMAARTEDES